MLIPDDVLIPYPFGLAHFEKLELAKRQHDQKFNVDH